MKLNFQDYKDKVSACWIGKNIGGTMGTPYEGTREMLDIHGFVTKPGEVLPNDDLDLQMVWLYALEKEGPYQINAALLGEFWLSFITPHWNEYGLGKSNMRRGLLSPMSGDYENNWQHSNGAWIRTEIWACETPGAPEAAARYAIEDAKVDHGAGEGTVAAAFVGAMQSAAFVLKDIRSCIEVALCVIPESSRVSQSVRFVLDAYDLGLKPSETRNQVQQMNADIGDGWFEAPSNVAYTVLGLLYGEGDFKRSMILAINCGDDTDCTGATVGATLGILGGMKAIPSDWREYLGDEIVTISIARGDRARNLPGTCQELTERVVRLAEGTLIANEADLSLSYTEPSDIPTDAKEKMIHRIRENDRLNSSLTALQPYSLYFECPMYETFVRLEDAPDIHPFGQCRIHLCFVGKTRRHENEPYNLSLRWLLPEGFHVLSGRSAVRINQENNHSKDHLGRADFIIEAGESIQPVNRLVLEVVTEGHPTILYIPITLLG